MKTFNTYTRLNPSIFFTDDTSIQRVFGKAECISIEWSIPQHQMYSVFESVQSLPGVSNESLTFGRIVFFPRDIERIFGKKDVNAITNFTVVMKISDPSSVRFHYFLGCHFTSLLHITLFSSSYWLCDKGKAIFKTRSDEFKGKLDLFAEGYYNRK